MTIDRWVRAAGMALVVASAGFGSSPAFAAGNGFLAAGQPVRPTRAWTAFCAATPAECRVDLLEPAVVEHTPLLSARLSKVNRAVNDEIEAVTDLAKWGVGDRWDYPTDGRGDCEDLQLEKRKRLAALGLPVRAMRIAMVINPEGEGHAVLVVRTTDGDLVLDNRRDEVLPWYRTGYVWVKREGDSETTWVSLGGAQGAIETAGR